MKPHARERIRGWFIGLGIGATLSVTAMTLVSPRSTAELKDPTFKTLSYLHIEDDLQKLAKLYPDFVQIYSAQERYGLPSAGECGAGSCKQWVMHITDHATLKDDPDRPEVGPTAVMEAAWIMVKAAVCSKDIKAAECDDQVITDNPEYVGWLARLALTRSTVMMPMTNAIGYYEGKRLENGMDPNRDFPYQYKGKDCMSTITARAVNEVWREHVFQLAVTFHGGMVAIAYEWGSENHPHKKDSHGKWQDVSPDHAAQVDLTAGLSAFAGEFRVNGRRYAPYPSERMNKIVYPVSGGMEDWGYAGSWDGEVLECSPSTYGGYPKEKTRYNSAMLRAFNILVEASDSKSPEQKLLGSRVDLFNPSSKGNGHITRNIRLTLMLVDAVQPYVEWRGNKASEQVLTVDAADGLDTVELEWAVGGAFQVNKTQLVWGLWPEEVGDSFSNSVSDMGDIQLLGETLMASAPLNQRGPVLSGLGRWGGDGCSSKTLGPTFKGRVELREGIQVGGGQRGHRKGEGIYGDNSGVIGGNSSVNANLQDGYLNGGDMALFIIAVAEVDQTWAEQEVDGWPNTPPQSHLINARTSSEWSQSNAGHHVRGRVKWYSPPVRVHVPGCWHHEDCLIDSEEAPRVGYEDDNTGETRVGPHLVLTHSSSGGGHSGDSGGIGETDHEEGGGVVDDAVFKPTLQGGHARGSKDDDHSTLHIGPSEGKDVGANTVGMERPVKEFQPISWMGATSFPFWLCVFPLSAAMMLIGMIWIGRCLALGGFRRQRGLQMIGQNNVSSTIEMTTNARAKV